MEFDVDALMLKSLKAKWKDEIERAIANAKRSAWDKGFRREWWGAGGRRKRAWARRLKRAAERTRPLSWRRPSPHPPGETLCISQWP